MVSALDAQDFQARLQSLDSLVRKGEQFADPKMRSHLSEVVRAILELHGMGLERILGMLDGAGPAGAGLLEECVRDEVVGGLLLLHGMHPEDMEQRVQWALEEVRPFLRGHGGDVELLEISEQIVHLRLKGSCDGCPSSAATMRQRIEEAILARAPDVLGVEVEGMVAASAPPTMANTRYALPVI